MAVKTSSSKSNAVSKKSYPKLIYDSSGSIYFAFARDKAVCVHQTTGSISVHTFYSGVGFNFELSGYTDYEGSVTLSNF